MCGRDFLKDTEGNTLLYALYANRTGENMLTKRSNTARAVRRRRRVWLGGIAVVMVVAVFAIWMFSDPAGGNLRLGQAAPDFTLSNALGGEVSLADYYGQQPVLIYFSMGPG